MNRQEFDEYMADPEPVAMIKGSDFEPPEDGMRLLCRGYHVNSIGYMRVWLRYDGMIGVQRNDGGIYFADEWETYDLYPTKRAFREDTDIQFARLMRERHVYPLSFTNWRD